MRRLAAVLAALVLGCVAVGAPATPITFKFTSTNMNGTLNGVPFSNQTMVMTLKGLTGNLINCGLGPMYAFDCSNYMGVLVGTFLIGGQSGNFSELLVFFHSDYALDLEVGESSGPWFSLQAPWTATYNMVSAFGPASAPSGMAFNAVGTSLGELDASGDGSTTTFQAILGSPLGVPEPGALGLFGLGLLGLAGFGLRRRH